MGFMNSDDSLLLMELDRPFNELNKKGRRKKRKLLMRN